eukprot:1403999-Rhodomonas_salina.3
MEAALPRTEAKLLFLEGVLTVWRARGQEGEPKGGEECQYLLSGSNDQTAKVCASVYGDVGCFYLWRHRMPPFMLTEALFAEAISDVCMGGAAVAVEARGVALLPSVLRLCYAKSGSNVGYAATRNERKITYEEITTLKGHTVCQLCADTRMGARMMRMGYACKYCQRDIMRGVKGQYACGRPHASTDRGVWRG